MAAVVAVLNAVLPPLLAALRLPFMLALGFVLVLILERRSCSCSRRHLLDEHLRGGQLRLGAAGGAGRRGGQRRARGDLRHERRRHVHRCAWSSGSPGARAAATQPTCPGSSSSRSTASRLPVLQRAMRDGNAPNMARWLAEDTHRLVEWETDLSSQTGASQAGILLGSNDDIPAFRWVEKESGRAHGVLGARRLRGDRAPATRPASGCSSNGGASRGNLLSGEAEEVILTVSRMEAEKKANPGYRAFFANGFNVTRVLVLFGWEVILEWTDSARAAIRRDVRPRGHRGGIYPFMRGGDVRDRARPDRLRRADRHDARPPGRVRDVLELRRGRPPLRARARRHARGAAQARPAIRPHRPRAPLRAASLRDRRPLGPRPDAGRDVQAAQRLRPRRARRALARGHAGRSRSRAATSRTRWSGTPIGEATGRPTAEAEAEERRLRPGGRRARLGQPRARLPDGGAAPADARGDRRAPPAADPGAARASAHRLAARALVGARAGRARARRHPLPRRGARRGRGPARARSRRPRRSTCCAPTASRTSPTSWSAASTTPSSTRAARSRS